MELTEVKLRLTALVEDVLDQEDLVLEDTTVADDVVGWDSLAHVRIVVAAEEEFNVRFTTNDALSIITVGGFIKLIISKTAS